MSFRNKFSMKTGLQKPPPVCKKVPPPPPTPTGCPLELPTRLDWWLDVKMVTSIWPDYFKVKLVTHKIGALNLWAGTGSIALDKDGPPRNVSYTADWTYDPAACDWQLAMAFGDDQIAFSGSFQLHLPLLDTLPMVIHWTSFITGDYGGPVEYIGLFVPDV